MYLHADAQDVRINSVRQSTFPVLESMECWYKYLEKDTPPIAFILNTPDSVLLRQLINEIRHHSRFFLAAILVELREQVDVCGVDGHANQEGHSLLSTLSRIELMRGLSVEEIPEKDRLLAFIYTRKPEWRTATRQRERKYLYHYPVIDALVSKVFANSMIDELVENGFLEIKDVFDRCRSCVECGSDHVNFIDACESCCSLEIERFRMVHCFACGVVSPEHDFGTPETMKCNSCGTELRRLGRHFEYLGKGQHCNQCHSEQFEETVVARCLDCDHKAPCGNTIERVYGTLSLTEQGEYQLLSRSLNLSERFGADTFVSPREFLTALQWEVSKISRQASPGFVMTSLTYKLDEDIDTDDGFIDECVNKM